MRYSHYEFSFVQNSKYPSINETILLGSVVFKSDSKFPSINEAILLGSVILKAIQNIQQ